MTDRAEIERLLNQTGRTLNGLPDDYEPEIVARFLKGGKAGGWTIGGFICHQSDVIELLVGALRDALEKRDAALAKVPKWISVEERLPEKHGQLCVGLYTQHGGDKSMLFPYIFTWHAYGDNGYVNGPHFSDEGLDGLKVYYWMPLPKAPEEE